MSRLDLYAHAASEIPEGQTRTFGEVAAMAGSPQAARAVGRALRSLGPRTSVPWQRVVAADGPLDAHRAARQLGRLRREGARARAGESILAWAQRCGHAFVASYRTRRLFAADDPRLERQDATRLEGFESGDFARARRFGPTGRLRTERVELPHPRTDGGADPGGLLRRLNELDVAALEHALQTRGVARIPRLLTARDCAALLAAGASEQAFDRGVHMEAKGYGIGTYRFWKEPLPEPARTLRRALYERLRSLAERSEPELAPLPRTLAAYHRRCRENGQARPSSILISYVAGGVNHPHQDAYGPCCHPFQALVVLSKRGVDFEGGDFVLWTERPDGSLEAHEIAADRGDLVVFTARRTSQGGRRTVHGMRLLQRGRRDALGLVLHLAQ